MKHECTSCAALRQEVAQLRESSERRAREDHEQCIACFQQMHEMMRLTRDARRCDVNKSAVECDRRVNNFKAADEKASIERSQIDRLQTIIVQQARELEMLRQRQRDTSATGHLMVSDDHEKTGFESAKDNDGDVDIVVARRGNQLCKLPLTSLHAQLKGKNLQLQRLQQTVVKLETRCGQLVDRKRSMAQNFEQTARTQQAHLKKYLSYIRHQTEEKKALERQVRDLNMYVIVLEKKLLA